LGSREGVAVQNSKTRALLVVITICAFSPSQPPRNADTPPAARSTPFGSPRPNIPRHHPYSSTTHNNGALATNDGGGVLDALNSEAVARAQRAAIANTIRQPVRVLVSSTFHDNYSKGNIAYADALKIGHENYRADLLALMQRQNVPADEQAARLPNQTF